MRLLLILPLMFLFACNTAKIPVKNDFKVLKTTQQKWQGRGNVEGIYYKATLEQTTKGKVEMDSMYINNKWHAAIVEDENPWVVMSSITAPKAHAHEGLELDNNHPKVDNGSIEIVRPTEGSKEFEGKNILLYRLDGKQRYLELTEFMPIQP